LAAIDIDFIAELLSSLTSSPAEVPDNTSAIPEKPAINDSEIEPLVSASPPLFQ
jgi:hypothetical protein